jgi:hypothetical protein
MWSWYVRLMSGARRGWTYLSRPATASEGASRDRGLVGGGACIICGYPYRLVLDHRMH